MGNQAVVEKNGKKSGGDWFDELKKTGEVLTKVDPIGYYNAEKSGPVRGQVVGFFSAKTKFGTRMVVCLQIHKCGPVECQGKGKEVVMAQDGDVIGIGISANLNELLYCVKGRCWVGLKATGKKEVNNGSMWLYDLVLIKGVKSEYPVQAHDEVMDTGDAASTAAIDEDLPF